VARRIDDRRINQTTEDVEDSRELLTRLRA
jgi:hypothetical protein